MIFSTGNAPCQWEISSKVDSSVRQINNEIKGNLLLWQIPWNAYLPLFSRRIADSTVAAKWQNRFCNKLFGWRFWVVGSIFHFPCPLLPTTLFPISFFKELAFPSIICSEVHSLFNELSPQLCNPPGFYMLVLKAKEIKLPQNRKLKPWVCVFVRSNMPPFASSHLLSNDTWTLLIDPRRLSRVDTGRRRSGLWASGSGGRRARVDTHICKCLLALRSGECPQVCRDLTYINSEMRSSQRRGILQEVGSKGLLMRRVQYPVTYPTRGKQRQLGFHTLSSVPPDDLHM